MSPQDRSSSRSQWRYGSWGFGSCIPLVLAMVSVTCRAGNDAPAVVRATFPEGAGGGAAVLLEKSVPREIVAGRPFEYRLTVRNLTTLALDDVVVSSAFPKHLRIEASAPPTRLEEGAVARWPIGTLEPSQSQVIIVRVTPLTSGSITHCDDVSFRARVSACATLNVISPEIHVSLDIPKTALVCDGLSGRVTVSNVGVGTARDVTVSVVVPEGITTTGGARTLSSRIAVLGEGQSQQMPFPMEATATGTFEVKVAARSGTAAESLVTAKVLVGQPVLKLTKTAPTKAIVGRPARITMTVANTGTFLARNLLLRDPVPAGAELVKASDNGRLVEGVVEWSLGQLDVGRSKSVTVVVRPMEQGIIGSEAVASAWCAEGVVAAAQFASVGVPAILLEVIDVEDPIEVGQKETYVITATNQGTARDTNIIISCQLEDTMRYVNSSGPTVATVTGSTVTFAPLPSLEPKVSASWRVQAQAVAVGDVRFAVQMNTDQLGRPVAETEATTLYGNPED